MSTTLDFSDEFFLERTVELIERFEASLPDRVDPAGMTHKSKLPFKIMSLRELLIHRVTVLSRSALEQYKQELRVPAFILIRSVVETTAVLSRLTSELESFLESKDIDTLDEFLIKGLDGGRKGDERATVASINVMTLVNHMDKQFEGFRNMYDVLCEYAHPNFMGTLDSFGRLDHENIWLDLGKEVTNPPAAFGLAPFYFSLLIFEEKYSAIQGLFEAVNEHFESNGK